MMRNIHFLNWIVWRYCITVTFFFWNLLHNIRTNKGSAGKTLESCLINLRSAFIYSVVLSQQAETAYSERSWILICDCKMLYCFFFRSVPVTVTVWMEVISPMDIVAALRSSMDHAASGETVSKQYLKHTTTLWQYNIKRLFTSYSSCRKTTSYTVFKITMFLCTCYF